jgi:hypothetical protein
MKHTTAIGLLAIIAGLLAWPQYQKYQAELERIQFQEEKMQGECLIYGLGEGCEAWLKKRYERYGLK